MRRRDFIAGLGSAVMCSAAARAQQPGGPGRVSVLIPYGENDPEGRSWLLAFTQELSRLGWTEGRNLRTDVRWAPGSIDPMRTAAKELVGLQPDVILSSSTAATTAFARETQTIPIVFAILSDPPGGPGRGGELRPAVQAVPPISLAGRAKPPQVNVSRAT